MQQWWQEASVQGWYGCKFMKKFVLKGKLKRWYKEKFDDLSEKKDTSSFDRCQADENFNNSMKAKLIRFEYLDGRSNCKWNILKTKIMGHMD